jgi:restriction endonuclease S subunit
MDTKTFLENFGTIADAPGGIERLRRVILEFGASGHLLPQDPADEPATVLFPSGPVDVSSLPAGWVSINFRDHCDIRGGGQPPKSVFQDKPGDGLVRLWQIRDFGPNPVPTYIPEETATRTCEKGDILIARYGASGKVFWAEGGAYNVAIAKFVYPEGAIFRGFAFLMLQTGEFQEVAATTTRMAQAGFNKKDLAKVKFRIPPLAEQKRVVAKVDELMALCDELEEKQQRKATITTKLRGSSFSALRQAETPDDLAAAWERISTNWSHLTNHPDSIPELRKTILDLAYSEKLMLGVPEGSSGKWDATTLGEVAEIRTGKLDANASSPSGQYPFFTCARLPLRIDTYTYDFECALIGGNGNFDVHYVNGKFDAYQRTYIIKPKAAEETSAKFLYWFMQGYSEELRKQSIGGVIQYLKIGFLKDAPLKLPSLPLQELLVAKIEFMLDMCNELEKQLQYRQDLSSRLAVAANVLETSNAA